MMTLFINTAAEESVVALYHQHTLVQEARWRSEQRLGADLLPAIDKLLHRARVDVSRLTQIVVYPGPGSFTGTRVGVTTANALAFSLNIPVYASNHAILDGKSVGLDHSHFLHPVVPYYATPAAVTLKKQ